MRLEDKELEGPELEREQRLEVLEQTEERDHELPELAHEEVVDLELSHRSRLFDALALILEGEKLEVPLLYLPLRETQALEALQAAVTGRDTMNMFVFAEDRAALLEQALAVLQQNLTHGSSSELAELHAKFDALTDHVAELRHHLHGLEDAQDELMEGDQHAPKTAASGDTTEADESVTGFIASALQALAAVAGTDVNTLQSTLDGPELPDTPKPPSALDGPERVPLAKPRSELDGPALPEHGPAPTTLVGPEAPAKPALPSTLDGPERPAQDKRSTLHTEGMSALIVPPERRSSPAIEPPTRSSSPNMQPPARTSSPTLQPPARKSSPAIDPPRNKFPSVAPPTRTGRATTPPGGIPPLQKPDAKLDAAKARPASSGIEPLARPSGMIDVPALPLADDAKADPSKVRITSDEPTPEPLVQGKPTRRGLSIRSTDKPKDKK